jgi:hypothetical protein
MPSLTGYIICSFQRKPASQGYKRQKGLIFSSPSASGRRVAKTKLRKLQLFISLEGVEIF